MARPLAAAGGQDAGTDMPTPRLTNGAHAGNDHLRHAQPVMGQAGPVDNPVPLDPELIRQTQSAEGDISIRRRPATGVRSCNPSESGEPEAVDAESPERVRKPRNAEHKKFEPIFSEYGLGKSATRWLSFQYLCCHRVSRSLAGGSNAWSEAQTKQTVFLCIVDLHRESLSLQAMKQFNSDGEPSSTKRPPRYEKLNQIIRSVTAKLRFQNLHAALHDWAVFHAEDQESVREQRYQHLVTNIGLFHTNAQRYLNAYAQTVAAVQKEGGTVLQKFPSYLASQWMLGPGMEEREALKDKSALEVNEFHHKLTQQYGLVCHSFGLPLPAMAELIVLDLDD